MNWLNKYKIWLKIAAIVILILYFMPYLRMISVETIVNFTPSSIPLAALAFFAIYALKPIVIVIPMKVLYVSAGIVLPVGWAIIITYVGLMISLSIGYINGRKLGEKGIRERLKKQKKIADLLEVQENNLLLLCFISRMSPIPFDLQSMFYGATKMPFLKHMFASLFGLTPVMLPFVFAGSSVAHPLSPDFLVPLGIGVAIILFVIVSYRKWMSKGWYESYVMNGFNKVKRVLQNTLM